MPTRRIEPNAVGVVFSVPRCNNTDHNPPKSTEHLEPGWYEHTCPACHRTTIFIVPQGMRHG